MTSTVPSNRAAPPGPRTPARRVGYALSILVNAAMLWGAHQLLSWRWPAFLTDRFEELLPIVTLSFVASIVVNAAYLWLDTRWFKSFGSAITSAIGVVVAWRTLQVFPFDFSSYEHNWSWLATLTLVVSIIGATVGLVVEVIRLVTWPLRDHQPMPE